VDSEPSRVFGETLRRFRLAAGLSQEMLAERSGLSRNGVSDLERGARLAPRLETVRMLAGALELDAADRAVLLAAARPAVLLPPGDAPALLDLAPFPAPLTRMIGRTVEIAAVAGLFARQGCRFVTLTGVGGTGKTRLAITVAVNLAPSFPDGIRFVDLSTVHEAGQALSAIAASLGVRETPGQAMTSALSAVLLRKKLLLVLDNCERVLEVGPTLAGLLGTCPGLTLLATSRERFQVRGEWEFPVQPMPLPDLATLAPLDELGQQEAIALFVERAMAVQPDFALSDANALAVASICHRLDGLPLAIELAAARVKALSPGLLLERLDPRLPLLTGGGRDLPDRQRTMRDALAWSYNLLPPAQQQLFRQVSVFTGGFPLSAAAAITEEHDARAVLDGVVALVDRSLVRQQPGGEEPRFQMLETVREFGLEQLNTHQEESAIRQRHARHFLNVAQEQAQGLAILMDQPRLARVRADHDNLRQALAWFDQQGDDDALVQVSAMLYGLWFSRGLFHEGVRWVERALRRPRREPSLALLRALEGAALLAAFQGDYHRAVPYLDEGLAVATALDQAQLIAEALTFSAFVAFRRQEFHRAEALLAEATQLAGERADRHPGVVPFFNLGDLALAQGQLARAQCEYEEAIALFQQADNDWGLRDVQAGLGHVHYGMRQIAQAAACYTESVRHAAANHYQPLIASSLIGLAGVAAASGRPEIGSSLLGTAEQSARTLGMPIFTRDLAVRDHVLATLATRLGDMRFQDARHAGVASDLAGAVELALEVAARA
jgi:predicted ATPase/transcriptional regulator with XRE-family HTH domain